MASLFPGLKRAGRWIVDLGVHEELSLLEVRQVRTVNGLALVGMAVQGVFTFFSVAAEVPAAIIVNAGILLVVCVPVPWLQARRCYATARVLAFFVPVLLGTLTGILAARMNSATHPEVLLISFAVLNVLLFEGWLRGLALAAVVTGYGCVAVIPAVLAGGMPGAAGWIGLGNALGALVLIHVVASLYKADYRRSQAVILAQNHELAEQRRQIQAQADELRRLNRVKDRIFSIIAHDLRSPVVALQGLVGTARDGDLARGDFHHLLGELGDHLDHTGELLDNLLRWAESQMRGFHRQPRSFRLDELVTTNARLFAAAAAAKNVTLAADGMTPVAAWADRAMVDLVVRNLVSNAVKFTPAGGRVTLGTPAGAGGEAAILIADTGVGMTAEDVNRVFAGGAISTSGTAGESGTGLGLMLVRDFVTANDGRLEVDSAPGAGTRFRVIFPATEPAAAATG